MTRTIGEYSYTCGVKQITLRKTELIIDITQTTLRMPSQLGLEVLRRISGHLQGIRFNHKSKSVSDNSRKVENGLDLCFCQFTRSRNRMTLFRHVATTICFDVAQTTAIDPRCNWPKHQPSSSHGTQLSPRRNSARHSSRCVWSWCATGPTTTDSHPRRPSSTSSPMPPPMNM